MTLGPTPGFCSLRIHLTGGLRLGLWLHRYLTDNMISSLRRHDLSAPALAAGSLTLPGIGNVPVGRFRDFRSHATGCHFPLGLVLLLSWSFPTRSLRAQRPATLGWLPYYCLSHFDSSSSRFRSWVGLGFVPVRSWLGSFPLFIHHLHKYRYRFATSPFPSLPSHRGFCLMKSETIVCSL